VIKTCYNNGQKERLCLIIDKFPITRHWHTVHSNKTELSPIAQRFKDFIIESSQLKNKKYN
jgi:hypothetical protein